MQITLSDVVYLTPSGDTLLDGITFSLSQGIYGLVGRNGVGKSTLLRLIAGSIQPHRGSVFVDGRIGYLVQDRQHRDGCEIVDVLGLRHEYDKLQLASSGSLEVDYSEVDWALDARIHETLISLGLDDVEPGTQLDKLSGGQATRLALGAALWGRPEVLLLDEPTNHLDEPGRELLIDFLEHFQGLAFIASHDRELLENVDGIVELAHGSATVFSGFWSEFNSARENQRTRLEQQARRTGEVLRQAELRARRQNEAQDRKNRAGERNAARGGDSRAAITARRQQSESSSGATSKRISVSLTKAQMEAREASDMARRFPAPNLRMRSSETSGKRPIVSCREVGFSYEADKPIFQNVNLDIYQGERWRLSGPNGRGKSTLLRLICGQLSYSAGQIDTIGVLEMLNQSFVGADLDASILDAFQSRRPEMTRHDAHAVLATYLFRAEKAQRKLSSISGGQILMVGLACALGSQVPPDLLMLDEPTNNLDIESIEALEEALESYNGALLVASHDSRFCDAININFEYSL